MSKYKGRHRKWLEKIASCGHTDYEYIYYNTIEERDFQTMQFENSTKWCSSCQTMYMERLREEELEDEYYDN